MGREILFLWRLLSSDRQHGKGHRIEKRIKIEKETSL